ncbi:MAG TPA: TonB-dependent siderophore receptor [Gemmatimonadaceae bacterium]|nr:TonB-dependent siderophore receptor [Gemmatimonadaceae bacterium]
MLPAQNRDTVAPELPAAIDTLKTAPHLVPVLVTGESKRNKGYLRLESSSATKTPTLLRNIPQSVTVINRALIDDMGMQNMADVVRYVPGITMGQGEGNRDQPTIRGNSTTADFFVDGVRDDAQYFRDLYNVERVEALKGSNAMIFGRGGGGGVLNRVLKEAGFTPGGEVTFQGGSFDNRRAAMDVDRPVSRWLAARFNGVYESSDLFRDHVWVKRQGINPTISVLPASETTKLTLGYENFIDYRAADRGIPSFGTSPVGTDISTFFGNPDVNFSRTRVNSGSASVTHAFGAALTINNRTSVAAYDKMYQNVLPGTVSADGLNVTMSAYNNSHRRTNIFSQTDVTYRGRSGGLAHTVLLGADLGRQRTDNFRNTGFFDDTSATFVARVSAPTISTPVVFRQSATDANNRVTNTTGSIYTQDQIELGDHLQVIGGVRYERFGIRYHDNRSGSTLSRNDAMISPRLGLILKPVDQASFYGSYSLSYLPSAGDQFSSLTNVTQGLEPEKFLNLEAGAKWDIADRLSMTAAVYQLVRNNTRAPDPNDPSKLVQTGEQRSRGYELGVTGRLTEQWQTAVAFARQSAILVSATTAAPAGSTVPLVPETTLSLWNKYGVAARLSVALGVIHQTEMYAAISNTVKLPAFSRADGAVYYSLSDGVTAQVNLENIFNRRYYPLANGNNNITPGAPRSVRVSLTTHF